MSKAYLRSVIRQYLLRVTHSKQTHMGSTRAHQPSGVYASLLGHLKALEENRGFIETEGMCSDSFKEGTMCIVVRL